ncbi:MAG: hypothetical protein ACJ719_01850 [Nitrososphaeraceae archaeon]
MQYIDWFYATFIKLQLVANVKPVTKYNEWYVCTLLDSMVTIPHRLEVLLVVRPATLLEFQNKMSLEKLPWPMICETTMGRDTQENPEYNMN